MKAEAIAKALGGKVRAGKNWLCRCPAHDDKSPSLSLADGNDHLLVRCWAGCDARDVLAALRRLGLLEDWHSGDITVAPPMPSDEELAEQAKRVGWARDIWAKTVPATGTLVKEYLEARGIYGPIPPTLRFAAALKHKATGLLLPAMVGCIGIVGERRLVGIHRTFLRGDGQAKAPVSGDKKMLGLATGGAVRLSSAESSLAICEGIETGLSLQTLTGIPTWAALSAIGIESLILPPLPLAEKVMIGADNDQNGRGAAAANKAAERWRTEGRRVEIVFPPDGHKDFNDHAQAIRGAA